MLFDIDLFIKKIQLKNRQRNLDKRFAEEGCTDEILEEQIEINKVRNEFNIPDEKEFVYEDYVQ